MDATSALLMESAAVPETLSLMLPVFREARQSCPRELNPRREVLRD